MRKILFWIDVSTILSGLIGVQTHCVVLLDREGRAIEQYNTVNSSDGLVAFVKKLEQRTAWHATEAAILSRALPDAYQHRLFANEVMLLPYYGSSLKIEHAYYERTHSHEPFEGLCFTDTLDMTEANRSGSANTGRAEREKKDALTVVIGNPPYNVGRKAKTITTKPEA